MIGKGQQTVLRRRTDLGDVADDFESMEQQHGSQVATISRQIAERMYAELMGTASHDLRSLLTPASIRVRMLLDRAMTGQVTPAELQKHLPRIVTAMADVIQLIDDIRQFSQPIPTQRRRERLVPLIQDAIENAQACFLKSGHDPGRISVRTQVPDGLMINSSKVHLVVAFTNLIQNALDGFRSQWNLARPCWISITAEMTEPGWVEIVIEDNGVGFGENDLKQIREFIPGYKTMKHDGTGFGLPTARRYIEAHGGTLEIDSQIQAGTKVRIVLPLEAWEDAE
jgi:signal transduction histidine kinase